MNEEIYLSFFSTEVGKKIKETGEWGFEEAFAFAKYFYELGKNHGLNRSL